MEEEEGEVCFSLLSKHSGITPSATIKVALYNAGCCIILLRLLFLCRQTEGPWYALSKLYYKYIAEVEPYSVLSIED